MKHPKDYDKIKFFSKETYFKYCIRTNDNLEEIKLTKEEIQAINLRDREGYSNKKCSQKMGMTLKSFEKLIYEARKKITLALTDGKSIKITIKEETKKVEENDLYAIKSCKFRCATCGYIYYINYEFQDIVCPKCNSSKIMSSEDAGFCKKWSHSK